MVTEERLRDLLPEAGDLPLRLWELAHLRACGVTIVGLFGVRVAVHHALGAQAKGLGAYLRAKVVDVPVELLDNLTGTSLNRRTRRRPERTPSGALMATRAPRPLCDSGSRFCYSDGHSVRDR